MLTFDLNSVLLKESKNKRYPECINYHLYDGDYYDHLLQISLLTLFHCFVL